MKISSYELNNIETFKQDQDKFCSLLLLSLYPESLIYSDMKTYIVGREYPGYTTWIWTIDNIENDKLNELINVLKDNYIDINKNNFIGKKELYNKISNKMKVNDYFEEGFLKCTKITPFENSNVTFIKANYGDKTILAKYWISYCEEIFNRKIDFNDSLLEVEEWLEDDKFYVLKDSNNKILTMAKYKEVNSIAEISHVYTPKDERGKGYCKTLIYYLTKMLLDNNIEPVLYTDYQYEASNKAYMKVGYTMEDNLVRFSIQKDEVI